ncbi:AraC family transcriptional regulator [Clostridioides difficile]|nr:AraC family transcriptional regulator [Clostridioides difficile]
MDNNLITVEKALDYIEIHLLDEMLNLEAIAKETGYSKYHLHRIFTSVVGFTVHNYIQRRRLTEAARMLIFTEKPIIEIALISGYDTQRSFSHRFKKMFKYSPNFFRKHKDFLPIQLKFDINNRKKLCGDMILDVKKVDCTDINIVGYSGKVKRGFHVIGKCWRDLHKNKGLIENKVDLDFLIGVNDYSDFKEIENTPTFTYIAGAQVYCFGKIPNGMEKFTLPKSNYIVFTFIGKNEDSMQNVVEYIYQEWFPNSSCQFNETNLYDFVKYGENVDDSGLSEIQFWVPIL